MRHSLLSVFLATMACVAIVSTAQDAVATDAVPADAGSSASSTGNATDVGQALNNCADPANVDVSRTLAESAEIIITGLVVVDAGQVPVLCVPTNTTLKSVPGNASPSSTKGPDLLLDTRKGNAGSVKEGTTLLVAVQCVHKGMLACRRNMADANALADAAGRCVIAVKVPPQTDKQTCSMYAGFRYMFMLSGKPAAACDGSYNLARPKVTESVRPHLSMGGANVCPPYPAWPSQSTLSNGDGLAGMLSQKCPGVAAVNKVQCSAPCKNQTCAVNSGVTCVAKSCEGRFMISDTITPVEACASVFFSDVTGLPVHACNVTDVQLIRQSRQSQKRVGILTGNTETSVDSTGTPRIVDPQGLLLGRFGSALGDAIAQQRQAASSPQPGSNP